MYVLIRVKLVALIIHGVLTVTRTPCTQTARFEDPIKGFSLDGNVLATVNVKNAANCVIQCLEHPQCQSINFNVLANPEHVCELNSKTANDVTLTVNSDVIYYGPTLSKQPNCAVDGPGECLNGGQCDMSCSRDQKLMCHCPPGRTGLRCENETVIYKGQDFAMVFPTKNVENYISIENSNENVIPNITVLFWINTLGEENMMVINYVKNTEPQLRFLVARDQVKVKIQMLATGGATLTFPVPPINDGYWHHVGITWSLGNYAIYLDGIAVYSGDNFGSATPFPGAGTFLIGQIRDVSSGEFLPEKSFVGNLSQVNVWNEILTADQIKSMSKSCFNDVGNLLDWSTVVEKKHGTIYKEDPNPCTTLRQQNHYDIVMSATPATSTQATHIVSSDNVPTMEGFTISTWAKHSEYIRYVEYTNNGATSLVFRLHKDVLILEISGGTTKQARVPRYWKESPAYWHHISTTWNSTTAHWKIYLDGSLVSIMHDVASGITIPAGGQLLLGKPDNGDNSINGSLSRLNIWNYEIDGHALSLMANQGPTFENGNVFAWYEVNKKVVGDMSFEKTPSDLYNSRTIADYQMSFATDSTSNYARIYDVFPNDITTVSFCFWCKLLKYSIGVVAYSSTVDEEELQIFLVSTYDLSFEVRGSGSRTTNVVRTGRWHFFCCQWRNSDGLTQVYKDGPDIILSTNKAAGQVIPGNGVVVVGQELDSFGGSFESSQSMKGEIAGLNFWSDFLTANEIVGMASGIINVNGNLLQWRNFRNYIYGTVAVKEDSDCDLPVYRVQKLRNDYCEGRYPGTYARFVRNSGTSYLWRCIRPSAMLEENMVYDIVGQSTSYFSRTPELLAIT